MQAVLNFIICSALTVVVCSCQPNGANNNLRLEQKLDSLQQEVNRLKAQQSTSDTAQRLTDTIGRDYAAQVMPGLNENKPSPEPSPRDKTTEKRVEKPLTQQPPPSAQTDQLHYYTGKPQRISARITPWIDGTRSVILYDPWGKETYRFDDVRHSYSLTSSIKRFHDNGAVAMVEVHNNPGASMYWGESEYTFGINNEPQWRVDRTMPFREALDAMGTTYYWKDGQWLRQEVVREMDVPVKE